MHFIIQFFLLTNVSNSSKLSFLDNLPQSLLEPTVFCSFSYSYHSLSASKLGSPHVVSNATTVGSEAFLSMDVLAHTKASMWGHKRSLAFSELDTLDISGFTKLSSVYTC